MKKILAYSAVILGLAAGFASCEVENDPTPVTIQKPIYKSDAYYENLRAYKKSDHALAFGWYGGWSAQGPSRKGFMTTIPDSVDMISLWSGNPNTPESRADMKFIQEVKGTVVNSCLLLGWIGKGLPNNGEDIEWPTDKHEALRLYADLLAQQIIDQGFQGFDIDYEPTVGGWVDVHDCPRGQDMVVFVEQLSKYFGPYSGTDRLLIIDGELSTLPSEAGKYFNYGIAQAYGSGASSCQSRYNQVQNIFRPEQFIVTENFESLWQTGGKLLEQAAWNPTQGRKGGCGTYHMEYEYGHADMEYKWLRKAIQIMNPAIETPDMSKSTVYLDAGNEHKVSIEFNAAGVEVSNEAIELPVKLTRPAKSAGTVKLTVDNRWIEKYNAEHGTSYEPLPEGVYTFEQIAAIEKDTTAAAQQPVIRFNGDLSQAKVGTSYMIPVVIGEIPNGTVKSTNRNYANIFITTSFNNIQSSNSSSMGEQHPREGWSGKSDVQEQNIPNMWSNSETWPSGSGSYPTYLTMDYGQELTISGFQFVAWSTYSMGIKSLSVSISSDGKNWVGQGKLTNSYHIQYVKFKAPVKTRYIKYDLEAVGSAGLALREHYIYQ